MKNVIFLFFFLREAVGELVNFKAFLSISGISHGPRGPRVSGSPGRIEMGNGEREWEGEMT